MEKLSLILVIIGLAVFIFSFWGFVTVRKLSRQIKADKINEISVEKYFELKSRQDYIVAVSAIVFSIITFIGYSSIDNIKKDISEKLDTELDRIDQFTKKADQDFSGLELRGKDYQDSVNNAFKLLASLQARMKFLYSKDVISQNIYIVDPIRVGDLKKYPEDPKTGMEFYEVKFSNLKSINGNGLPYFKSPPTVLVASNGVSSFKLKEVFEDRFTIYLESYLPQNEKDKGESATFSVWISQKPSESSFNSDFSDDFK